MADILCLGLIVADVIANPLEALPEPGTLEPCPHISLHVGGCAANTGSALAKLGLDSGICGAVGEDGFGSFLRQELCGRGLNLKGLKIMPATASSASIVAVNRKGERSFAHHVGANAKISAKDFDWGFISKHKILHVGGSFLMPRLDGKPLAGVLKQARKMGLKTSLDTVYNPSLDWAKVLKPCLSHLDYFLPSYEEARQISGKREPDAMVRVFQSLGASVVAIKMGEKGSYVHDGKTGQRIPAPKIKPVDTTGAGDAFCGGFLAGILKGWPLKKCAQFGNVLGASCCLDNGAYAGLPDKIMAAKRMKNWYKA
jgi:sugar/nucleoside kinase (ribokinase family)